MSKRKYIIEYYPKLMAEYLNEKNKFPIDEIYVSFPEPVWWRCEKGHEWQAKVTDRTFGNHGCIYCTGQVPVIGENDLATTHSHLVLQWHPTKNGDFTPDKAMHGSSKKVWWLCEKGHEWEATIGSRADQNTTCPYCSGHLTIIGENDLMTTHPEIAKEWHPSKNGNLKACNVKAGNSRKIWWICKKGHEWQDYINERVKNNKICPFCKTLNSLEHKKNKNIKRKRINSKVNAPAIKQRKTANVLIPELNSFKAVYPELVRFWDIEKNGDSKPENYSNKSSKKFYWKCEEGHEWKEEIITFTNRGDCPYCSGARLKKEDSAFSKHPELLEEFDFDKNFIIDINKISCGSSKKLWWKCKERHSWLASVHDRLSGNGCPYCSKKKSIYSI